MYKFQLLAIIIYIQFISTISGTATHVGEWNITYDCEDGMLEGVQKPNGKIKVELANDYIKLECDKTMSVDDFETIPAVNLSEMYRRYCPRYSGDIYDDTENFIVKNCVMPPNGLVDVVRKFNVTAKINSLSLDECVPSDRIFRRGHFNGFRGIGVFKVRSAEAVLMSQNALEYITNITELKFELPDVYDMRGELFRSQRKLEKFVLRETPTNFTKEFFTHLTSITELHIEKSVQRKTRLQSDSFQLLYNVVDVELIRNRLTALPSGLFHSNRQLETLTIIEPDLKSQPDDLLVKLKQLTEFTLTSTLVESIHINYFERTTHLTSIDMSDNKLASLPDGVFRNLHELTTINLSNNRFTKLPTVMLTSGLALSKLEVLDLSDNQIDRINSIELLLAAQSSIYLINNRIATIDFSDILSAFTLRSMNETTIQTTLYLDGNPIRCDDKLKEFIQYMDEPNKLFEIDVIGGECSTPMSLANQTLTELEANFLGNSYGSRSAIS